MRLHTAKFIAPALAVAIAAVSAAHAAGGAVPGAPDRYESTKIVSPCSPGSNFCQLTFAAVPAGKVLEATNISCEAGLSGPTSFDFMEFVLTSDSSRKAREKTAFPIKAADPAHFFLNEAIRFYFEAGAQPTLAISNAPGDASGFLLCTLSGNLLTRAA
jgi:hypothetical protein